MRISFTGYPHYFLNPVFPFDSAARPPSGEGEKELYHPELGLHLKII